ncbi:MAG: DUF99 family protein [Candidatus Marsarchaeota archaeon]|nr:DUF99 family protein [Candidatus Marsarchaeota archaeon]MCL5418359.1 DUF99 family protein [Candidatus Marsarchaeota archaeon]
MKSGIRLAAFASGPIGADKHAAAGRTILIAVVAKKGEVEGVLSSSIGINGTDSTDRILTLIKKSRFASQVKLIVLNGIALAGLNVVNPGSILSSGNALMIITRHKPRPSKLIQALNAFSKRSGIAANERKNIVKDFAKNKPRRMEGFYVQSTLQGQDSKVLFPYAVNALRLAHMIASGMSKGESKGRL